MNVSTDQRDDCSESTSNGQACWDYYEHNLTCAKYCLTHADAWVLLLFQHFPAEIKIRHVFRSRKLIPIDLAKDDFVQPNYTYSILIRFFHNQLKTIQTISLQIQINRLNGYRLVSYHKPFSSADQSSLTQLLLSLPPDTGIRSDNLVYGNIVEIEYQEPNQFLTLDQIQALLLEIYNSVIRNAIESSEQVHIETEIAFDMNTILFNELLLGVYAEEQEEATQNEEEQEDLIYNSVGYVSDFISDPAAEWQVEMIAEYKNNNVHIRMNTATGKPIQSEPVKALSTKKEKKTEYIPSNPYQWYLMQTPPLNISNQYITRPAALA